MPLRPRSWWPILLALAAITLPIVVGYLWIVIGSFNTRVHGLTPVGEWTLENWRFLGERLGRRPSIWTALLNTLLFAGGVSSLVVTVSAMAAYAISRLSFPGRGWFLGLVLVLHAFPAVSLLIASYYVLSVLGLFDTLVGVVLVILSLLFNFVILA